MTNVTAESDPESVAELDEKGTEKNKSREQQAMFILQKYCVSPFACMCADTCNGKRLHVIYVTFPSLDMHTSR